MKFAVLGLFLVIGTNSFAAEAKFVPVGELYLSGGQTFFENKNTSLGGNFKAMVTPAVLFSERTKLLPTYLVEYRGIRKVEELAGGGFLTQETLNYYFGLKYIRNLSNPAWSIKPYASFKLEYLNESADESFGEGLYDWWKYSTGIELERKGNILKSQRFLLGYYGTRFTNYDSLAAVAGVGDELKTGTKVLNFKAMDISYTAEAEFNSRFRGHFAGLASHRPYDDQNIAKASGDYELKSRTDLYLYGAIGGRYAVGKYNVFSVPVILEVGFSSVYAQLDSDQNTFDSTRTKFIPDYYDYTELSGIPSINFYLGKRNVVGMTYSYTTRNYKERLVQNTAGNYHDGTNGPAQSEKINQYKESFSMIYKLLLFQEDWGSLYADVRGTYLESKSNMLYEVTYPYNYYASNYFTGISWEFGS